MAHFEPTAEERAACSYLAWDDAALGRFTKHVGLELERLSEQDEGLQKVTVASSAMLIIGACVDMNAGELTLTMDGYSHAGIDCGDWMVTVKKKGTP